MRVNVNGLRPYQSNNLSYKYNSHSQIQYWIIVTIREHSSWPPDLLKNKYRSDLKQLN